MVQSNLQEYLGKMNLHNNKEQHKTTAHDICKKKIIDCSGKECVCTIESVSCGIIKSQLCAMC